MAVYNCNCLHVSIIRVINVGFYHFTKFRCSTLPVSEIVLPEGVYCCFTGTALYTTMSTMITLVCSLNSMCIPSFVLTKCCVRELLCSCMSLS